MMLPPSATLAEAVSETVVVSIGLMIVVVAAAELIAKLSKLPPVAEAMMMFAARREHVVRVIRPFLEAGGWVVCDRFADSTRAYQGGAGGVDPAFITALETFVLTDVRPDLTLVFDLPVEVGLARAEAFAKADGHAETRFESKGVAFHERLRAAGRLNLNDPPAYGTNVIPAGMSREQINRQLAIWADSGIIERVQGQVRILDPDTLMEIAESGE